MRETLALLMILSSIFSFSQLRIFNGYVGKYPIQLVTYSYSDGDTRAIYAYDKFDIPIVIDGKQGKDSLSLFERNEDGEVIATFMLPKINAETKEFKGKWLHQDGNTLFEVRLTKLHEFESYDETSFDKVEFIQAVSTRENYFKLLISKDAGDDARVDGVRIYEKKTDQLLQELKLDCQLMGLNSIFVADYNFDGIDDFSVFEAGYAGPNTSSVYILKDPESGRYFISEIYGVSLDFDFKAKLIYEHNQCCAGTRHINTTYKLVDNKMVMVAQKCFEYDEEKDEIIEKDCD